MALADQIRDIYRKAAHPFNRLWSWAKNGTGRRWVALTEWARRKARRAPTRKEEREWRERAQVYAKKKRRWLERHHDSGEVPSGTDFVTFDGHPVPRWIVEEALAPARRSGVWTGTVISGYRTPEYSEQLCYGICGAPSCPGKCAGRSSNHCCPPSYRGVPYEGAVDVTQPASLQRWTRAHNNPIRGNGEALPQDLVHFSRSGH